MAYLITLFLFNFLSYHSNESLPWAWINGTRPWNSRKKGQFFFLYCNNFYDFSFSNVFVFFSSLVQPPLTAILYENFFHPVSGAEFLLSDFLTNMYISTECRCFQIPLRSIAARPCIKVGMKGRWNLSSTRRMKNVHMHQRQCLYVNEKKNIGRKGEKKLNGNGRDEK